MSVALREHSAYITLDPSSVADSRCSKVRLPGLVGRESSLKFCGGTIVGLENDRWLDGWHEPMVVHAMLNPARAARGVLLDIGANAGLFSIVALSGTYQSVLSFEPQPACADALKFMRSQNGSPSQWRIFNYGVARNESAPFAVPGVSCGMNWQLAGLAKRKYTASAAPLSSIVSMIDQGDEPVFLKIDTDGSEVAILEAVVDLIPPHHFRTGKHAHLAMAQPARLAGGHASFARLPELYVEVNPADWHRFEDKTLSDGVAALMALGKHYTDIYFFSGMTTSCEGIGLHTADGTNLTEPYLYLGTNRAPNRWAGKMGHRMDILRITDFRALVERCVLGTRPLQMNLWFAR